jgi:rod shape-determining protein MreD
MSFLLVLGALLASTVAQVLISGSWPTVARFFDLPLLVVIYYAISKGPTGALLAGAGAGLLQDSLEGTLFGVSALSRALVGYLVGILGLRFALAPFVARVLVLAAATVLTSSIEVGTLAIMGRRFAYSPFPAMLEAVVGNCLLGAPLVGALKRQGPE